MLGQSECVLCILIYYLFTLHGTVYNLYQLLHFQYYCPVPPTQLLLSNSHPGILHPLLWYPSLWDLQNLVLAAFLRGVKDWVQHYMAQILFCSVNYQFLSSMFARFAAYRNVITISNLHCRVALNDLDQFKLGIKLSALSTASLCLELRQSIVIIISAYVLSALHYIVCANY